MKILLATESYWPSLDGGALFERRLAYGISALGHSLSIWAPAVGFSSYIQPDGPTTIYREKSWVLLYNPKYRVSYWPFWSARRVIKQVKPNVIHIHNAGLMGLSALMWAKRYHIPVLGTNHFMPENALLNMHFINRPFFHALIWRYLVWFHNKCNFVTSPTPTAVQLLVDRGLKSPHKAITNGIDTAVFHPGLDASSLIKKYNLPTDRPILLYLGRVDGEKRIDLIISALPLILKHKKTHLVIAGAGVALNACKKQARDLGVESHISFTGFLDEDDKPLLYTASSMFLMASPAELQSIVILEAMATGLPIVSVDVAALKELCQDGVNGYLFKRDDYQELAVKTLAILENPQRQQDFGKASLKIIGDHHSTDVTFHEYELQYKRLVQGTTK